ncbi:tetratricopeptide repeat protein [Vibrio diabolicus]|uniref:tetratricopeptide repeat protein n=1 Tax=Vibrio diabolicus TaxID=50719 RepID=UPI0024816C18|nr:tetratricopeptide repeat protein [Vibrio diabolicus]
MNNTELRSNYQNDLVKSLNTPLLIELNESDITSIELKQSQSFPDTCLLLGSKIYDDHNQSNGTNIIVLDGEKNLNKDGFYLLETLLDQLQDEIKDIKNIAVIKETLIGGLSVSTGGLLNEFLGSYLDKGLDLILEGIGSQFTERLFDNIHKNIDISDVVLSQIEGLLQDNSAESLATLSSHIKQRKLSLSADARLELKSISSTFAKSGKHDIFQLAFKMLLATSIGSNKLIFVNNPHKLDDDSLAVLSLLFSYAKHLKEYGRHLGISVIYAYSNNQFQPYRKIEHQFTAKQLLLDNQRRFAQRYAMLESPTSDMPVIAVKSSHFVGRNEELNSLKRYYEQRQRMSISVVSGEPGIGKTTLIKKHLEQISTEKMITLTLLNEIGHQSTNTGLSSLEKSILEEASRLEILKGWKEKGIDYLKSLGSKSSAVSAIGSVFSGADKIINITEACYERFKVKDRIVSLNDQSLGDLNNKQGDTKERQFKKLDLALDILLPLADRDQPVILFIDDCQWIDDTSSEYILTRLAKKCSLFIVTSIRPSDAATALVKQEEANSTSNTHCYTLSLLKVLSIKGHERLSFAPNIDAIDCHTIVLEGFNQDHLHELIENVITGEPSQLALLSCSIIQAIGNQTSNKVNTLFAIECINLLCEPKFYNENKSEKLILTEPFRLNQNIVDIEASLQDTFKNLLQKYQHSLSHSLDISDTFNFSLMAYAVLEERLYLLKIYFAKHGNAAVNSLLFSSLLGAPFSATIVKSALTAIASTEEASLLPLRNYIRQSHQEICLTEEQYVIIDEVYEILRRYSTFGDKYDYRHSLQSIFLDKQLNFLLKTLLAEDFVRSNNALLRLLLEVIDEEEKRSSFFSVGYQNLNTSQFQEKMFYQSIRHHILLRAHQLSPDIWGPSYVDNMEQLSESYFHTYQLDKAAELQDMALQICEVYFGSNQDSWAQRYTSNLAGRAETLRMLNKHQNAITLLEQAVAIIKPYYQNAPSDWAESYSSTLNLLAYNYALMRDFDKAVFLSQRVLDIVTPLYRNHPQKWASNYMYANGTLVRVNKETGHIGKAISLSEHTLEICKSFYSDNSDKWSAEVVASCIDLALLYRENEEFEKSKQLAEKAYTLCKYCYRTNPDLWIELYVQSLDRLAHSYSFTGPFDRIRELKEETIAIIKPRYQQQPEVWAFLYAVYLNSLINYFHDKELYQDAITMEDELLTVCRELYHVNPKACAELYASALNNIVGNGEICVLYKLRNPIDISEFQREYLNVCRPLLTAHPAIWAKDYCKALDDVASDFWLNDQKEYGLSLYEERLSIIRQRYIDEPLEWESVYMDCLEDIADKYHGCDDHNNEVYLLEELVQFTKHIFQKNSESGYSRHTRSLSILGNRYTLTQQHGKAIETFNELLLLLNDRDESQRDMSWLVSYSRTLNDKAKNYKELNQLDQAIACGEASLSISRRVSQLDRERGLSLTWGTLNQLAHNYRTTGQHEKATYLAEELVSLCKPMCGEDNERWGQVYLICLTFLADCYHSLGHKVGVTSVCEVAEAANLLMYESYTDAWEQHYLNYLKELAEKYRTVNELCQSVRLENTALSFLRPKFYSQPDSWMNRYLECIARLSEDYFLKAEFEAALALEQEILPFITKRYGDSPMEWSYRYAVGFSNIAKLYKELGSIGDSLWYEEETLPICIENYQSNPKEWFELYTSNLSNIADLFSQFGQFNKARFYYEHALSILKLHLSDDPIRGLVLYTECRNKLTTCYEKLGQNLQFQ